MHSYCYWRFRGLSVGNETIRYPAKTAGLIEMSFGMWGGVGDSHHVLDGGTDPPPREGEILGCESQWTVLLEYRTISTNVRRY